MPEVNGVYGRSLLATCDGADVFRKAGTTFALLRNGEGQWSLANLHSATSNRWSLKSLELYRGFQIPAGNSPPHLGWLVVEGTHPAPMVHLAKAGSFTALQDEKDQLGLSPQLIKSALSRAGQRMLSKTASEPRMPLIKLHPSALNASAPLPRISFDDKGLDVPKEKEMYRKYICSFRITLTRPTARLPWGVEWAMTPWSTSASRVVGSIANGSPMNRWNVWQKVRGRKEMCVEPGDQLVRVDGRWAFPDAELSTSDADEATMAIERGEATAVGKCIVMEFLRPVFRPPIPAAPKLETWDSQAHLVLNWRHTAQSIPYKVIAWALCLYDLDRGIWLGVDGASQAAVHVGTYGADLGALDSDIISLHVRKGVTAGRTYACCIAALSPRGWSPFSELSRARILYKAQTCFQELMLDKAEVHDNWPTRPRFAIPTEMVPGATSPVSLVLGPRDFLGSLRRIRLRTVVSGCPKGLLNDVDFQEVGDGAALMVTFITPGSAVAAHNDKQRLDDESIYVHGAIVAPMLRPGDLVLRANGISGTAGMLEEMRRCPKRVALTLERRSGGEGTQITEEEVKEALFPVDNRLDAAAVQAAEPVNWVTMLHAEEATLAMRMVENNAQELERAIEAATTLTLSDPQALHYPTILVDAERRAHVVHRTGAGSAGVAADGPGGHESVADDKVLLGLKRAMGDVLCNPDALLMCIKQYGQASHAVRTSQVGQNLLERATHLEALWRWQRECVRLRERLLAALDSALQAEAYAIGVEPEYTEEARPPHNSHELVSAIKEAAKFGQELEFPVAEASEVVERLTIANERWEARRQVELAAQDPMENEKKLVVALNKAELKGVDSRIIAYGRDLVKHWQVQHVKNSNHDELYTAVIELRRHIDHREKPGAGSDEQRRVRRAIAGSGLPTDDPLVREASKLLRRWEGDNLALRSEARLQNAVRRARLGYKPDAPEAGDLLGSAIAEVSQQGVEARYLEDARDALASWQASRLKRASSDLSTAIEYRDQDFLKEAIVVARKAGVERDLLEEAIRCLRKLQMEDEINTLLERAMEAHQIDDLEVAVRRAHHFDFVESESPMLLSGSLQVHLRFWATEFKHALRLNNYIGLKVDVERAKEIVKKSEAVLPSMQEKGVREVAFRTLERDLRGLKLVMPKTEGCALCQVAEDDLKRVLIAVERYAEDLPEVIKAGELAVSKGLERDLVTQAQRHMKEYTQAVQGLTSLITFIKKLKGDPEMEEKMPTAQDMKTALIKARLAGAPYQLVVQGSTVMDDLYPEVWGYTKLEMELLVALREADDIDELPAEGRFMRVQNAADECRNMRGMQLPAEILEEVLEKSITLAAERILVVELAEAEGILSGRITANAEKVVERIDKLKRACDSCEAAAHPEAQRTLLPRAEYLLGRLEKSEQERKELVEDVNRVAAGRGTTQAELRDVIIKARQGYLPQPDLTDAYAKLRKKKIEFLPTNFRAALVTQRGALTAALWLRGVALRMHEERSGVDWKQGSFERISKGKKLADVALEIEGAFTQHRCGGSFGTPLWRQNPYWVIRRKAGVPFDSPTKVTVAIAEIGDFPATLSVHVVRNSEHAAVSGLGTVLVTGFEVLSSSTPNDDVPVVSFTLPEHDESRPVFLVPSAALGEFGKFTLCVECSDPIEVEAVADAARILWRSEQEITINWTKERPHSVARGGGRTRGTAPFLAWYRNPQFRICLKRAKKKKAAEGEDSESTLAIALLNESSASRARWILSDEDEERLKRIFLECDVNGGGDINKKELVKAVKRNAEIAGFFGLPRQIKEDDGSMQLLETKFALLDRDHDESISWDEFCEFFGKHCKKRKDELSEAAMQKLELIFTKCDKEGEGKITKKDLVKACLRDPETARFFGCKNVTQDSEGRKKLEEVFLTIDKDGGKHIVFDELAEFYHINIKARTDDLAPAVLQTLKTVFEICDAGETGRIGKNDLVQLCKTAEGIAKFFEIPEGLVPDVRDETIENKFQALDSELERDTDWDEFVKFYRATYYLVKRTPELDPDKEAQLGKIFGIVDVLGDGFINKRELIKALRKHNEVSKFFGLPSVIRQEDGSRDMMEAMFQTLDEDGDRQISWEEFLRWYHKWSCPTGHDWGTEAFPPGALQDMMEDEAELAQLPPPKIPLLFARLVPAEGTIHLPCAVHIVKNRPGHDSASGRIAENPALHDVIADSLFEGNEYNAEAEVGAVCKLSVDEDGDVIVILSLEGKLMEGAYILQLRSTEEIVVKTV